MLDFRSLFIGLEDPRSLKNQVYPFEYMLLSTLCACMAGETSFSGIADYADINHTFFKEHFDLPDYAPHHDTYRYILDALDHESLYAWFDGITQSILQSFKENPAVSSSFKESIAIDGKTIRNSTERPLHLINAWCTGNRLILGSQAVNHKSNEIKAIPLLLNILDVKGRVITIDAMGAQREICQQVIDYEGDYCVALKQNQKTLYDDVATYFKEHDPSLFTSFEHHDKGHGRLEKRVCRVFEDTSWLQETHQWPGLKSIVELTRTTTTKSGTSTDTQFYISSLQASPDIILDLIRKHWLVENSLHWVLDVTFNQDKACIRNENSAFDMDILSKIAINVLNANKKPGASLKSKQRSCWNPLNPIKYLLKFYHS